MLYRGMSVCRGAEGVVGVRGRDVRVVVVLGELDPAGADYRMSIFSWKKGRWRRRLTRQLVRVLEELVARYIRPDEAAELGVACSR